MQKTPFFLATLLVLAARESGAQERNHVMPPFVRVSGEATVSVEPDQAQIDIGVTNRASTSQAAAEGNARQAAAVLAQMKRLAPAAKIRTINYSINPEYKYPAGGGKPTITGYTANNTVRIQLDELSLLPKILDASTESGANTINQLNFTLRDETVAKSEALAQAAGRARASADALANATHRKVGQVLQIEEGSQGPILPRPMMAMARAEKVETPISAGTIEVRASVTITFELTP